MAAAVMIQGDAVCEPTALSMGLASETQSSTVEHCSNANARLRQGVGSDFGD